MAIVFHNDGLIDPRAIKTFGVNVKDNANAIGYFGTGMKYALAVILRGGGEIYLYNGHTRIDFGLAHTEIRGKKFQVITMDDEMLGFTTELGKDWEPWMAFRELYCNALDEEGGLVERNRQIDAGTTVLPDEGNTMIVVKWVAFDLVYDEMSKYFLPRTKAPMHEVPGLIEVYENENKGVFYKGVRVMLADGGRKFLYTYNLLGNHQLTEDRTLHAAWKTPEAIRELFTNHCDENKDLMVNSLCCSDKYMETLINYDLSFINPSDAWYDTVADLHKQRTIRVNPTAINKMYNSRVPEDPEEIVLDEVDKARLERAIDFCTRAGWAVDDYPIMICESLGRGVLAQADKKVMKIFLCQQLFNQGTKLVVQALIEEFIHLRHDLDDETRGLQTYLFETIVSQAERLLGDPL
jgi:hypothetical protein